MLVGGFVSASGGLHKAIERGNERDFEVVMYFIGSPHSWNLPHLSEEDVNQYAQALSVSSVKKAYAHALYLVNLASPEEDQVNKSIQALITTMNNGNKIGLSGVIFHMGSHKNTSSRAGLDRVVEGMKRVLDETDGSTKLIMENAVQQGNKVGVSLEEIGYVYNQLESPYQDRVAVCLDTCHGFAEGYDYADPDSFATYLGDIERHIGFDAITCFHVNDSQGERNSHKDRHANLGDGFIGLDGFRAIINEPRLAVKDFILEIPGIDPDVGGPGKKDRDLLLSLIQSRG